MKDAKKLINLVSENIQMLNDDQSATSGLFDLLQVLIPACDAAKIEGMAAYHLFDPSSFWEVCFAKRVFDGSLQVMNCQQHALKNRQCSRL